MTCVFEGGARTKRLSLFKPDENRVALLAEGSLHLYHIEQKQVNC